MNSSSVVELVFIEVNILTQFASNEPRFRVKSSLRTVLEPDEELSTCLSRALKNQVRRAFWTKFFTRLITRDDLYFMSSSDLV